MCQLHPCMSGEKPWVQRELAFKMDYRIPIVPQGSWVGWESTQTKTHVACQVHNPHTTVYNILLFLSFLPNMLVFRICTYRESGKLIHFKPFPANQQNWQLISIPDSVSCTSAFETFDSDKECGKGTCNCRPVVLGAVMFDFPRKERYQALKITYHMLFFCGGPGGNCSRDLWKWVIASMYLSLLLPIPMCCTETY